MRLFYAVLFLFMLSFASTISLAQNHPFAGRTLSWSPDGEWLAIAKIDGTVILASLEKPTTVIELKHTSLVTSLTWSPDLTRIATIPHAEGLIYIWEVSTGTLLTTLQADASDYGAYLAWNPKQEILVSLGYAGDGGMYAWFWDTETYTQIGSTSWIVPITVRWNPDGNLLAVADLYSGLKIFDNFTGQAVEPQTNLPEVWGIDWSPDGKQIVVLHWRDMEMADGRRNSKSWISILDAQTLKEITQVTEPIFNTLRFIRWSPDSSRIVVLSPDHVEIIDAESTLSLEQLPIIQDQNSFNFAWSPYGGRLAIVGLSDNNIGTQAPGIPEIQILVPAPSLDLLDSIKAACVPTKPPAAFPTTDNLGLYIDAVKADASLPPACAADLIAVAEALRDADQ